MGLFVKIFGSSHKIEASYSNALKTVPITFFDTALDCLPASDE